MNEESGGFITIMANCRSTRTANLRAVRKNQVNDGCSYRSLQSELPGFGF
jgi:hypothetical protein